MPCLSYIVINVINLCFTIGLRLPDAYQYHEFLIRFP